MTTSTQAAEAAAYRLTHAQGRSQQDTTGDLFGITAEDAQRERQRREAMAARPPREKDLFAQ